MTRKVFPMNAHTLETMCDRCGRRFRQMPYYLIRHFDKSGERVTKRTLCLNCYSVEEDHPWIQVEKWYERGKLEVYTRRQVSAQFGHTSLTEDGLDMVVVPYNGSGVFRMHSVWVKKGTRLLAKEESA